MRTFFPELVFPQSIGSPTLGGFIMISYMSGFVE